MQQLTRPRELVEGETFSHAARALQFAPLAVRVTPDVYAHAIHGQDDEAVQKWIEFQRKNRPLRPHQGQ